MRSLNKKNNTLKTILIVTAGVLLIGGGVYAVYAYTQQNDDIKRDENGISTERTPQDKKLEENLEKNPEDKVKNSQTDTPQSPSVDQTTNLQKVNVILTNVGQSGSEISASGFISNSVEQDGVCTYIFTQGTQTIKKTSSTLSNANSTTCTTVRLQDNELSSGVWKVQIDYKSKTSSGISNELEVSVK